MRMPELSIGLSKTAQGREGRLFQIWTLKRDQHASYEGVTADRPFGKRLRVTSRIRQGRLSVLG